MAGALGSEVLGKSKGRLRIVPKGLALDGTPRFVTCRPWPGAGIDDLLLGDVLGPRAHDLGRTQWNYLGGVGHAIWFAMKEAVMVPPEEDADGPALAGFGTNLYSA